MSDILDRMRKAMSAGVDVGLKDAEIAVMVLDALRNPPSEVISAMACSRARDDEGQFEPLMDLIGFSGENKTHTVLRAAWEAAIDKVAESVGK